MSEAQYLYLTTIGRISGQPREIEIWFAALGRCYYLIAEHRERAQWVRNLLRQPRISFRVGDQRFTGLGRVLNQARERELWQSVCALFDRKYGWSDGLVVELAPDEANGAATP
jgi:deazaflavin-dependent oxidoreductase (nitroreductase family)